MAPATRATRATRPTRPTRAASAAPLTFDGFPTGTFRFLRGVTQYNEQIWFNAHRALYDQFYVPPALALVAALGPKLRQVVSKDIDFEARVGGSMVKIQTDPKHDKKPFKTYIGLRFWERALKKQAATGFFLRLGKDRLFMGAGVGQFQKAQLDAYRAAVLDEEQGAALVLTAQAVLASDKKYGLGGRGSSRMPKGFPAKHPRAEYLKYDGLFVGFETRVPKEARSAAFVDYCAAHFAAFYPITKWLHGAVLKK